MCLAIPVKLVSIEENIGWVEIGATRRKVSLILLPDAKIGDYILMHAGFAISKVEEEEVKKLFDLLNL